MTHAQFIHTYASTDRDFYSPVFHRKFVSLWMADIEFIPDADSNDTWAMYLMFDGI